MTCGRTPGVAGGAAGAVGRAGAERAAAVGALDAALATADGVPPVGDLLVAAVAPQPSANTAAAAGAATPGLTERRSTEVNRPTRPSYFACDMAWTQRALRLLFELHLDVLLVDSLLDLGL
jgi:hypothetical protein